MSPFIRNMSFHSVNLVGLLKHDLPKCSAVFQEVVNLFRQGIAKPIHPTTFMPFSQIEEGFRLMQMGKHVGKIVFEVGDNDLVPVCPLPFPLHCDSTNITRSFPLASSQFNSSLMSHIS